MPRPTRSAAAFVQPRECSSLALDADVELTRPQKRRRRLQLLAVHRASSKNNAKDTNDKAILGDDGGRTSLEERFGLVEALVIQIHWHLIGQWIPLADTPVEDMQIGDTRNSLLSASAPEYVPSGSNQMDVVLRNLRQPMPSFPSDSVNEQGTLKAEQDIDAAIAIQRVWRGSSSRQSSQCKRCGFRMWRCCCEDILCVACFRSADVCDCKAPSVRSRRCAHCSFQDRCPSLYSENFLEPRGHSFQCSECGWLVSDVGDVMWLMPSEHQCSTCMRRDAQRRIRSFDGRDCGNLHHSSCMTRVTETRYLCKTCVENGIELEGDEAEEEQITPSSCSNSSGNQDGRDENPIDVPQHGSKYWGDEEILIWTQVTMRMLNHLSDEGSVQELLCPRWDSAKDRLPPDKRERLRDMIGKRFNVSLC